MSPLNARPTVAAASQDIIIPAYQLRSAAASHLQATVLPLLPDAWAIAHQQLRCHVVEGGAPPTTLDTYVEALYRSDRWADCLHIQAVADVLRRPLCFFATDDLPDAASRISPTARWTAIGSVRPHGMQLAPLDSPSGGPLLLGILRDRV